MLVIFAFAMIPLHYLASFYFEAAATGFSKMCFINIFSGKFIEYNYVCLIQS